MELRQMEYFLSLCEHMNFTLASQKLGITQPALSIQMKSLEKELGVRLFDRIGKKLMITESGEVLREGCVDVFNGLGNVRDRLDAIRDGSSGRLRIGALEGDVNSIVAPLLGEFHTMYPNIQVSLIDSEDIEQLVLLNEIDIGISIAREGNDRLTTETLYSETMFLVVPRGHELSVCSEIEFKRLADLPVVLFRPNHQCRRLLDKFADLSGFAFRPRVETTTVESIMSILRNTDEASVLPGTLAMSFASDSFKLIQITNPTPRRDIEIVRLKDKFMSQSTRAFVHILRHHAMCLQADMTNML